MLLLLLIQCSVHKSNGIGLIVPCMDAFVLSLVSQKSMYTPRIVLPSSDCRWSIDAILKRRTLEKPDYMVATGDR